MFCSHNLISGTDLSPWLYGTKVIYNDTHDNLLLEETSLQYKGFTCACACIVDMGGSNN
jgi:hypothetical protein